MNEMKKFVFLLFLFEKHRIAYDRDNFRALNVILNKNKQLELGKFRDSALAHGCEIFEIKKRLATCVVSAAVVTSIVWIVAILMYKYNYDEIFRQAVENKIASIFSYQASSIAK